MCPTLSYTQTLTVSTAVRGNLGFHTLPKDTLVCRIGETGIKPLTLWLLDDPHQVGMRATNYSNALKKKRTQWLQQAFAHIFSSLWPVEVTEFTAKSIGYMTPSSGMWKIMTTLEDSNNSWQSAQWGQIEWEVEIRAMLDMTCCC